MKNNFIILVIIILLTSCTKREVIFDSEISENFELALILKLNGKDCLFDSKTNTLKYSLSESDLTNFTPLTVFNDYSEIEFNGQLLENNSINNLGSITLNTVYPLKITTLDDTRIINLVFTKMPLIQIISFDEIKNEPKTLARMVINYPEAFKGPTGSFVGIEIRGKSSSWRKKKSYGFKALINKEMDNHIDMAYFNMASNSKWSLDAMYVDESKVRNKTSFEIWNSLSNTSIKSKYVEVFLNNSSLGLYRFSENYTEKLLQLTNNSALYVGTDNTEVTKFEELPKRKPKSALWEDWKQEYPNPRKRVYWDDFYEFSKIVTEEDDQIFISEIEKHIEIDNLIDYYLFMNLCYGYDNVGKNWFFLKRNQSSKFTILVWDLDATWGRNHNAEEQMHNLQVSNELFNRLIALNPNGFNQKLKTRWFTLRTNQFSEVSLLNKFDSNFKEVLDYDIINPENIIWDTYVNLENEQQYINAWISNRLIYLDNYYNEL